MRRISETFLDFAEPLLEAIDNPCLDSPEAEAALKIACLVWNSIVMNQKHNEHDFLAEIRQTLTAQHICNVFIDKLVEDKITKFASDLRLIESYGVVEKPDGTQAFRVVGRTDTQH